MGIALIVAAIVVQLFTVVFAYGVGEAAKNHWMVIPATILAIASPTLAYIAGGLS